MTTQPAVLVIGLLPELVDFTPFPGMDAATVRRGIAAQVEQLSAKGYAAESLYVDFGATAESVVAEKLAATTYACVVIGAGARVPPVHFLLFEKLINVVHARAPQTKIAFNTSPTDTVEAVQRWV